MKDKFATTIYLELSEETLHELLLIIKEKETVREVIARLVKAEAKQE